VRARSLSDVARVTEGSLEGADVQVRAVATDSREVGPGTLFVALTGERTDGHRFVDDAFAAGAAAALVQRGGAPGPVVRVASTGDALLRLAADERSGSTATVIGVTGANGKTSTKDLTRAVLATRHRTHASPASFNNEVGLPMTLLGAPEDAEAIVAEMGARRLGDVKLLCGIARPDVVVVTNVGLAHMEVFGSWASIVEAGAEPVEALEPDGVAVLNADDAIVAGYAERCAGAVVTFGTGEAGHGGPDVTARDVALGEDGRATFRLVADGEAVEVTLAVPGEHMVSNALAAAAVGLQLEVPLADAAGALAGAQVSPWRMEAFTGAGGVRVLNDAYNANPESTAAALRTARWVAGRARLVAVLGEMAELGPIAEKEHDRVGELAARIRVDRLVVVGEAALPIARAAVREGMDPADVVAYADPAEAIEDVRRHAAPGDLVLCKGSRVAGLERVAEALR
jgi:UDP-N-acetylmuramoyl-tripeptide--D-alanyl-D-alanine ligase